MSMDTPPVADYDSPWKVALARYLPEAFALFFPQVHSQIDWSRGYTLLDKELQQVTRDADLGRRLADTLVQVWRRDGTDVWVLVHIEVQGQPERDFAQRMFVYYYRIFDRYERPIMSVAVLADEQADWRPTRFDQELWGCTVEMRYPVVKLLDWQRRQEELEDSANPFATVVLAHLAAQQTRGDMQDRGRAKLTLTRRLYERGYGRQDVLELYRFIDWLLQLPAALETQVWQDIVQFEEAAQMTYLSTAEQRGREQGLQEGRQEGLLEGLAVALDLKFGPAGVALIPELRQIGDPAIVQAVAERIKTAQTVDELRHIYADREGH